MRGAEGCGGLTICLRRCWLLKECQNVVSPTEQGDAVLINEVQERRVPVAGLEARRLTVVFGSKANGSKRSS